MDAKRKLPEALKRLSIEDGRLGPPNEGYEVEVEAGNNFVTLVTGEIFPEGYLDLTSYPHSEWHLSPMDQEKYNILSFEFGDALDDDLKGRLTSEEFLPALRDDASAAREIRKFVARWKQKVRPMTWSVCFSKMRFSASFKKGSGTINYLPVDQFEEILPDMIRVLRCFEQDLSRGGSPDSPASS